MKCGRSRPPDLWTVRDVACPARDTVDVDAMVIGLSALLGLLVGSFANVVVARIPEGGSLSTPASACPQCATPIRPYDNIPVLSWLLLRGRCRDCSEPISPVYPLLELTMALLFALVAVRVGVSWALPGFLLFTWLLVVVSLIDIRTRKIPNRLTYPLTPALLVLLVAGALLEGEPAVAVRAFLGGVAAFGVLLVLALIQPKGMGMGDVKLAGFIGIGLGYLSWAHVALGIFLSFLLGGVIGVLLMATGKRTAKDKIPFGPYLAVGALIALLAGTPLLTAYLRSAGLV